VRLLSGTSCICKYNAHEGPVNHVFNYLCDLNLPKFIPLLSSTDKQTSFLIIIIIIIIISSSSSIQPLG
jgi:hypothetical protein